MPSNTVADKQLRASKLSLVHKGLSILVVMLVVELIFLGLLGFLYYSAQDQLQKERAARDVISHLDRLSLLRENSTIGLLKQIEWYKDSPDSPRFQRVYKTYLDQVPEECRIIRKQVEDNPVNAEKAKHLEKVCLSGRKYIELEREAYLTRSLLEPTYLINLEEISDKATRLSTEILDSYRQVQEKELAEQRTSEGWIKIILVVGVGLNIIFAIVLARVFMRGIVARLQVVKDNSFRLAWGKPLLPEISGDDEITDLDRVFHKMAEMLAESARKERAIMDNAVDVICSIDADGRFASMNPAATKVLGYEPADLIGKRSVEIVVKDQKEKTYDALQKIIQEQATGQIETQLVRKDGSVIDVLWSVQWAAAEKSLFCVLHDISERKQIERMKQEFVAMISHDLRSPLMSVEIALSLLSAGALGEISKEAQSNVSTAERNLSYVMSLINGLLDVERMEVGKLTMHFSRARMGNILERSMDAIKPLAEKRKISLEVPSFDAELSADEGRLLQVMINLLSNALKFSPPDSKVTVEATDKESSVEIRVNDQGPGISSVQQGKLFHRFERGDFEKGPVEGTGLGLSICKAIIEAHGGTIGVESVEGKGSTFWFNIPKQPSKVQRREPAASKGS